MARAGASHPNGDILTWEQLCGLRGGLSTYSPFKEIFFKVSFYC